MPRPPSKDRNPLSLVKAAGTLDVVGAVDKAVQERAYELGATLAATLID